ncbi:sensor histidine kinase [Promicromonospora iranensis]|uniref:histidine kinase n=1 Tax=Promicromonospora iranensis TaxID=1105144 RepID=A0ABU2CSI5_9MICO|nr:histidine kinase [Promicromonospora iranensis]MDR7384307.1 signal transduction histidine kinase [Promicromonospora iranensis]
MSRLADLTMPVARAVTRAVMAEDRRGDVITAVGLLVIAFALDALGLIRTSWSGLPDTPSWWFVVPAAVGCAALVWRRFHPLGSLGVVVVAFGADTALGGSVGMLVVLWEALYCVHLHGRPVARRVTAIGVGIISLAAMIVVGEVTGEVRPAILAGLQAVTLLVMPMWWGGNVRQGRELTAAAHERTRLERERSTALLRLSEAARHDAVRAERTAVARDLHDVVASHLSAITITSGAALAGAAEPERDRAALRSIRAESLASLQDMQAMIRVLSAQTGQPGAGPDGAGADDRGPDGTGPVGGARSGSARPGASGGGGSDLLAAPRVAQLAPVLEQVRLAGLDLEVTDPGGVLDGDTILPAAVDHAVYRVVRESLTNVLKHGGARAGVRVAVGEALELEVHDDGVRPGGAPPDPADVGGGTGLGLLSMRERVESLGGSFAAGPAGPAGPAGAGPGGAEPHGRPAGTGWRVRAVLPMPEGAVQEPSGQESSGQEQAEPAPTDQIAPELRA